MTRLYAAHNYEEAEASRVLDLWKAGADDTDGITRPLVDWCLRVLGDGLGVKHFSQSGEQIIYLESRA